MITLIEDGDYDFNLFSHVNTANYDEDNGSNIDADGRADYDPPYVLIHDDLIYNFGNICWEDCEDDPETAEGDYDFGDLDLGVDPGSKAKGDYDFNKLSGYVDEWLQVGLDYNLTKTALYCNYCSTRATKIVTGNFIIYDKIVVNNRIRVTRYDQFVGVPCAYSGWVDIDDILKSASYIIGDRVKVFGKMYQYSNGIGNYSEEDGTDYYISAIQVPAEGEQPIEYPIGLSAQFNSTIIGYTNEESIVIQDRNTSRRT